MATIWLTYAWADNQHGDVDFVVQELEAVNVSVKLDRWNIKAGKRLWAQIEHFIQSSDECDAWVLYATQHSLGSQACKEEYAYALDRALKTRHDEFPIIALFPAAVDDTLVPAGVRIRLHVSLGDQDWKERIRAAAEGHEPMLQRPSVSEYHLQIHRPPQGPHVIEVRPRAGSWSPFFVAVPTSESEAVGLRIARGPAGRLPSGGGMLFNTGEGITGDGLWAFMYAQDEATPTQSYYLYCKQLPSL